MVAPETTGWRTSVPGQANATLGSHDDVEYEYDPNETEDFYFTLDLSSHDPNVSLAPNGSQEVLDGPVSTPATPTRNRWDPSEPSAADTINETSIQILDLQSDNPLVKLRDNVFSCNWSTDLGSQVYVTLPGLVDHPLHTGRVLDVVSVSRARLIGRPAKLRKRQEVHPKSAFQSAATQNPSTVSLDPASRTQGPKDFQIQDVPATSQQIARFAAVRAQTANPGIREQASFLERLSVIKQQRGEDDVIPFYGVKQYKAPANFEEIRERALQADPNAKSIVSVSDGRRRGNAQRRKRKVSSMQNEDRTDDTSQSHIRNGAGDANGLQDANAELVDTTVAADRETSINIDPSLLESGNLQGQPTDPNITRRSPNPTPGVLDDQEKHGNPPSDAVDVT